MKRITTTLLLMCLFLTTFAQEEKQRKNYFSASTQLLFSGFIGEESSNFYGQEFRPTTAVSPVYGRIINGTSGEIAIETGFAFINRTGTIYIENEGAINITSQYIDIPLGIAWRIGSGEVGGLYMGLRGICSIPLSQGVALSESVSSAPSMLDIKETRGNYNLGFGSDIGAYVNFGISRLTLAVRVNNMLVSHYYNHKDMGVVLGLEIPF